MDLPINTQVKTWHFREEVRKAANRIVKCSKAWTAKRGPKGAHKDVGMQWH